MELSRREFSVLQRAVERYIQAGVPVASRHVAEHQEIGLSSASVRVSDTVRTAMLTGMKARLSSILAMVLSLSSWS